MQGGGKPRQKVREERREGGQDDPESDRPPPALSWWGATIISKCFPYLLHDIIARDTSELALITLATTNSLRSRPGSSLNEIIIKSPNMGSFPMTVQPHVVEVSGAGVGNIEGSVLEHLQGHDTAG